jgi:hypothetical protein
MVAANIWLKPWSSRYVGGGLFRRGTGVRLQDVMKPRFSVLSERDLVYLEFDAGRIALSL